MGYNTTVIVLNDALDQIESDTEFGAKLANACLGVRPVLLRRRRGENLRRAERPGHRRHLQRLHLLSGHTMKTNLFAVVGTANMILNSGATASRDWHKAGTTATVLCPLGMSQHTCERETLQLSFNGDGDEGFGWLLEDQEINLGKNGQAVVKDVDGALTTLTFLKTRAVTAADLPSGKILDYTPAPADLEIDGVRYTSEQLDAAVQASRRLVLAYARAESGNGGGGSVSWEEVNDAWLEACASIDDHEAIDAAARDANGFELLEEATALVAASDL